MKNNEKTLARQQKPLRHNKIHPWIELDPVQEFEKFTQLKLSLIDWLMHKNRVWVLTEPSQDYIGKQLGCHRVTINRIIQDLYQEGILSYLYRHRHTCVYYVSDFFRQPHLRKKLQHLFPSITMLGLSISLITSAFQNEMLHQLRKRSIKRDNNSVSNYYYLSLRTSYFKNTRALGARDAREDISIKKLSSERAMFDIQAFRSYIQRLTKLNVSTWGAIKLSAFPTEVLVHCAQDIQREERSLSFYNELFNRCWQYCKERDIPIDIYLIAERGAHANVSSGDSVLYEEKNHKREVSSTISSLKDPLLTEEKESEYEDMKRKNKITMAGVAPEKIVNRHRNANKFLQILAANPDGEAAAKLAAHQYPPQHWQEK